jgi:hypothetical protein
MTRRSEVEAVKSSAREPYRLPSTISLFERNPELGSDAPCRAKRVAVSADKLHMCCVSAAVLCFAIVSSAADRCSSCERDGSGRIHQSSSARAEFRRQNACPATGDTSGPCPGYVIDHIVPLACGGEDTPENMQWQSRSEGEKSLGASRL